MVLTALDSVQSIAIQIMNLNVMEDLMKMAAVCQKFVSQQLEVKKFIPNISNKNSDVLTDI